VPGIAKVFVATLSDPKEKLVSDFLRSLRNQGTGLDIALGGSTALPDPARMLNQELYCRDYIVVLLGPEAEVDAQSIRDGIERELRDTPFAGLPTKVIVVAVDDPSRRITFMDGFATVHSVQPDWQNVILEIIRHRLDAFPRWVMLD
jgi:hypothetical protein